MKRACLVRVRGSDCAGGVVLGVRLVRGCCFEMKEPKVNTNYQSTSILVQTLKSMFFLQNVAANFLLF